MRRSISIVQRGLAALTLSAAGGAAFAAPPGPVATPGYVGSAVCAACHVAESTAWRGSHHDLAMQEATDKTVLGDFGGTTFTHGGVTSRFFRRDGRFFVNTDGPDGKLADFEIRYTFGVFPLQQYLIAFADGRMQALGIAWDSRPREQGGQRWFHLYPDPTPQAGDPLHWTGIDQTWNFQCAECHSTELRKNYDAAADIYATTWAAINVGCEACHGPGGAHVAWAQGDRSGPNGLTVRFDERRDVHWTLDPATGNAVRSRPRATATEVETCGTCHSRSTKIAETWRPGEPLLQSHVPAALLPGLFEADGKMLDEVYNYAPFLQSKMFAAGVTCSDCHDPHSLKLRAAGDQVCLHCHDGDRFAVAAHHHHAAGSTGAACVACHMPARTYMVVDPRHDHAFRIPRPDESVRFGTSNACTDCHADKDAAWAAAAVERWFGPERKGFQTWTETFAAARTGRVEAAALLANLAADPEAPAIARATAMDSLALHPGRDAALAARKGLADVDPLVRMAALRALRPLPVDQVWPMASPLLADPVRGVRVEAVSLLAAMPQARLSPDERGRLARAIDDYVAAQRVNADRPEHRVNLGNLFAQQRRPAEAEAEYRTAVALDPSFAPAYVNLAQLYAGLDRDGEGERLLRDAVQRLPEDAGLHLALGLNLVRQRRAPEALDAFRRAVELDPGSARHGYVYGVALNAAGRIDEAVAALEANHARHPADRETLVALVTINRDAGRTAAAVAWAERLAAIDPSARPLLEKLRARNAPR